MLLSATGCLHGGASPSPSGLCSLGAYRPYDGDAMTDRHARWTLAVNEYGAEACGWQPN